MQVETRGLQVYRKFKITPEITCITIFGGLFICTVMEGCGRRLRDEPSYRALQEHYETVGSKILMRKLFEDDQKRFEKFRFV